MSPNSVYFTNFWTWPGNVPRVMCSLIAKQNHSLLQYDDDDDDVAIFKEITNLDDYSDLQKNLDVIAS